MTIADQLRAEGYAQGYAQGFAQGVLESTKMLLRRLLSHRFGELPQWVDAAIDRADVQLLEQWIHPVAFAKSLETIFGTGHSPPLDGSSHEPMLNVSLNVPNPSPCVTPLDSALDSREAELDRESNEQTLNERILTQIRKHFGEPNEATVTQTKHAVASVIDQVVHSLRVANSILEHLAKQPT